MAFPRLSFATLFGGPAKPEEGQSPAPIRQAAPQSDDAPPSIGSMISRDAYSVWLPGAWMGTIASNPDSVLAQDGFGDLTLFDAILDDETVMSTLQQRRLAITSRDWEVAPGDDKDPLSVAAAEDWRKMLKGAGIDRITGLLHYGVFYGYAVGEAIYSTKLDGGKLKIWLDDIVVPDRRWFGFTLEGELRFVGKLNSGFGGEKLPDNKFVTIRTGGTHDFAFYGMGLAHWLYWPVFFKRAAIKFWALYLEKFGMPTVAIEYPSTEQHDTAAKEARLAAAVAVGQDRAILVPEGTISKDQMKLLEAERSGAGASSYKDFVDGQDESMMRVVLGQPGTSKGVASGLNSNQASEHSDVKAEIVKADSDMISEALLYFATWLTRWNYGPDVAPPTVYRVLDDPEDLNTVAERDSKLSGLGITRTEESVKQVYGDGYDYEKPPSLADKAAQAAELAKAAAGAKPAANNNQPPKSRAAAFAAEFGVEDEAPLYVRRDLLNVGDLRKWAESQGIKGFVPDAHVTVLYSKAAVDWFAMGTDWTTQDGKLTVQPGGPRTVVELGDGAIVLRFASTDLQWRHNSMIEAGASSDFPEYKPHITLTYDGSGLDLSTIEPYAGELRFGPEIFETIKPSAPLDAFKLDFTAADEEAIDRLIESLVADTNPIFAAMASEMRGNLQGVTTLEGARVALLAAFERMPVKKLAEMTGLSFLAERAGAVAGAEGDVTA